MRKVKKFTTVQDIRYILNNWGKKSSKAIALHLGLSYATVSNIARKAREKGVILAKNTTDSKIDQALQS